MPSSPIRIAIFASGSGSNAESILQHFSQDESGEVVLICTNRSKAGVITRAEKHGIACEVMSSEVYQDSEALVQLMKQHQIDLIALAGYLKLIPAGFTRAFSQRIINIHPGLLPRYGGKGMYGKRVHQAVLDQGGTHAGISIHYVDEVYDRGPSIYQYGFQYDPTWDVDRLAAEVLQVEHRAYPLVLAKVCRQLLQA